MTKACWIGHVSVDDPAAFQKYGARFLLRGGVPQVVKGRSRPRCMVIGCAARNIRRRKRCATRSRMPGW